MKGRKNERMKEKGNTQVKTKEEGEERTVSSPSLPPQKMKKKILN